MSTTDFVIKTSINSENYFCSKLINNSHESIESFMFCFSLLAPVKVIENCILHLSSGGYAEIKPNEGFVLKPGDVWSFKYAYEESRHKPMNYRWSPQGCFLKTKNQQIFELNVIDLDLERISSVAPIPHIPGDKLNFESLRLVPHPYSWSSSTGVCNLCPPINVFCDDNLTITRGYESACDLGKRLNLNFFPEQTNNESPAATTSIKIKYLASVEESSYEITITSDVVEVTVSDETGLYYGLISLMQLAQTYHQLVPCGTIIDKPRFNWRGQHLDTVRHFYSVDSVLKLLDLMSLFKLNKFHWHGADDEAFRFKLADDYDIATSTSKRGDGQLVPPVFGSGPGPIGGCYDLADIKRITDRASKNYIEVMPEFDLPGHNMSLLKLYPSMRDPEDQSFEVSVQGYSENTLNPAMPDTSSILETVIDDLCKVFPGEYIHLGADEIAPGAWSESPLVDALKAKHNLENSKDVASWFINKLSRRIESNNKKTAAWQEAEDGHHHDEKIDKLLFSWQNLESGLNLARQGYKVVLCPAEHIYFDMVQSRNYADRGANWAAVIPFERTVDWEIIPENEPELEANIEGIQGHLWSETILEDYEMESMLCPRILGLSESAWSSQNVRRSSDELNDLALNSFRNLFEKINWDFYKAENFDMMSGHAKNKEALVNE